MTIFHSLKEGKKVQKTLQSCLRKSFFLWQTKTEANLMKLLFWSEIFHVFLFDIFEDFKTGYELCKVRTCFLLQLYLTFFIAQEFWGLKITLFPYIIPFGSLEKKNLLIFMPQFSFILWLRKNLIYLISLSPFFSVYRICLHVIFANMKALLLSESYLECHCLLNYVVRLW